MDKNNVMTFDVMRSLLDTYSVSYIVITTKFTTHHIERLSPTVGDRGKWKWIAEMKVIDWPNEKKDSEAHRSHIDHQDCFPRYYFLKESLINEIRAWFGTRELITIDIEAPKF